MGSSLVLPEELIVDIFSYLKPIKFVNMRLINAYFNDLVFNRCNRLIHFMIPHNDNIVFNEFGRLSKTNPNVNFGLTSRSIINDITKVFDMNKINRANFCYNYEIHNLFSSLTNLCNVKATNSIMLDYMFDSNIRNIRNITSLSLMSHDSTICDIVRFMTNITDLSLNLCHIGEYPMCELTNITKLSLCRCSIRLDNSIYHLMKLTTLCISECMNIMDRNLIDLTRLNNLTKLDLMKNDNITDKSICELTNIIKLKIDNCPKITYEGIKNNTNLRSLICPNNKTITNADLMKMTYLTNLDLYHNEIIADYSICRLTSLRKLCVSKTNHISNHGISSLTNIRALDISNSFVMVDVLLKLTNITELYVSKYNGNDINGKTTTEVLRDNNIDTNSINIIFDKC